MTSTLRTLSTPLVSAAILLLLGCSADLPEPADEEGGDEQAGEGGEGGQGTEGEGEGGDDPAPGTEGEGEAGGDEGGEGEGEGEGGQDGGEGEGEGEGEGGGDEEIDQVACRPGAEERCRVACVIGGRTCRDDGRWGECDGRVNCDDPGCHERFRDLCPERPCEAEARRPCNEGCLVGTQGCDGGEWGECEVERVGCRDPRCAEAHDECRERPCEPGEERRCGDGCVGGVQVCGRDGWSGCRPVEIHCEVAECAELHGDECGGAECRDGDEEECRDHCQAGMRRCDGGRWSVCHGEIDCDRDECRARFERACAPAECDGDAVRECEDGCVIGAQGCREGRWGPCRGRVRCDDDRCAAAHPDACIEHECRAGDVRRCREGCLIGGQRCRDDGEWGECALSDVDCADPGCAERHADACADRECEPGAEEGCRGECFEGVRACHEGRWSDCRPLRIDCDDPACVERHPECQAPACDDGARRECERECVTGEQACVQGRWSVCLGDVRCEVDECADQHPRACAPAECEDGAEQACERGCIRGAQLCRGGRWGECAGRPDCDDERCAEAHPELCRPPECEDGHARECRDGCRRGMQVCRGGHWRPCELGAVDCDAADCADHEACQERVCDPGAERPCRDECLLGHQSCGRDGQWGECQARVRDCETDRCREHDECQAPADCDDGAERECREHCVVGAQACREGRWGPCEGRPDCERDECAGRWGDRCAPPECDEGAARRCERDCLVGEQTCRDGHWSECRGHVACDDAACAAEHPEACERPDCEAGDHRDCETRCGVGVQGCGREGGWGPCDVERVLCELDECRAEHPRECDDDPAPEQCEDGDERRCREGCFVGAAECRGGDWGPCVPDGVDCHDDACREDFPDECEPDRRCAPGDERDCASEDGCVTGLQECADAGTWSPCRPQDANCDDDACAEAHPLACAPDRQCEPGDDRPCESDDGCGVGGQRCTDAGFWGACHIEEIRCEDAACRRSHPRACAQDDDQPDR